MENCERTEWKEKTELVRLSKSEKQELKWLIGNQLRKGSHSLQITACVSTFATVFSILWGHEYSLLEVRVIQKHLSSKTCTHCPNTFILSTSGFFPLFSDLSPQTTLKDKEILKIVKIMKFKVLHWILPSPCKIKSTAQHPDRMCLLFDCTLNLVCDKTVSCYGSWKFVWEQHKN